MKEILMAACPLAKSAVQCAEIEDLLGILGVQANVFRIVNPGAIDNIIQTLRKAANERAAHRTSRA